MTLSTGCGKITPTLNADLRDWTPAVRALVPVKGVRAVRGALAAEKQHRDRRGDGLHRRLRRGVRDVCGLHLQRRDSAGPGAERVGRSQAAAEFRLSDIRAPPGAYDAAGQLDQG